MVDEVEVKKCKERDVLEGSGTGKVSRRAESIFCIWTSVVFFTWVSESWLKVESNVSIGRGAVGIWTEGQR